MSQSRFHLRDKHMTTGRINQVTDRQTERTTTIVTNCRRPKVVRNSRKLKFRPQGRSPSERLSNPLLSSTTLTESSRNPSHRQLNHSIRKRKRLCSIRPSTEDQLHCHPVLSRADQQSDFHLTTTLHIGQNTIEDSGLSDYIYCTLQQN